MLERYLVQTCEIVTTIRSEWGDYVLQDTIEEPCRFRVITTTRRETHRETDDSDAMIWLASDSSVDIRSIVKFDGIYYQIERINKARKLGGNTIEFIKCDLKIIDLAIS